MFPAGISSGVPASKRLFDLLAASAIFTSASPVLLILALLVRVKLGTPVLFRQLRPGYRGKPFLLNKFRTMTDQRDAQGKLLPDAERLTRLGRFLRGASLDELPELINVLRGEMSLVVASPPTQYLPLRHPPEQARRHEVLPGITGWAQVNGRNALTWQDKFRLDVVRGSLVILVGSAHPVYHPGKSAAPGGHQPARACHRPGIYAKLAAEAAKPLLTKRYDRDTGQRTLPHALPHPPFRRNRAGKLPARRLLWHHAHLPWDRRPTLQVCSPLAPRRYLFSNHRCHGHFLAYGGDPRACSPK